MKDTMSFEQALTKLEEITRKLESGEASLGDSLTLFEEGVALTSFCNKLLEGAEQKISVLQKNEAGERTPQPFVTEEEHA